MKEMKIAEITKDVLLSFSVEHIYSFAAVNTLY